MPPPRAGLVGPAVAEAAIYSCKNADAECWLVMMTPPLTTRNAFGKSRGRESRGATFHKSSVRSLGTPTVVYSPVERFRPPTMRSATS